MYLIKTNALFMNITSTCKPVCDIIYKEYYIKHKKYSSSHKNCKITSKRNYTKLQPNLTGNY